MNVHEFIERDSETGGGLAVFARRSVSVEFLWPWVSGPKRVRGSGRAAQGRSRGLIPSSGPNFNADLRSFYVSAVLIF